MDAGIARPSTASAAGSLRRALTAALVVLPLGLILAAAAAVRLWDLGAQSLWFDEAYSVFVANQPLTQIPRLLHAYDTHPPLHYILLHFWIAFAGKTELAVRLPSVLVSLGVVALTYIFARRLADRRVALLAAALLALHPFQVTAAREARMYPFLTLFLLGGSYALWMALQEGRAQRWVAYGALMTLALYTHHFAFLIVLTHGLFVVAEHRGTGLRAWAATMAAVGIAYLPIVPALTAQMTAARAWPVWRPPFGLNALTDLVGMFSFGGGLYGMGNYFRRGIMPLEYRPAILLPFLLLAGAGAAAMSDRRRRAFILGYWLIPPLVAGAVSLRWNIFYERYFSFVLPAFVILLAAGVIALADRMRGPGRATMLAGLLALLAAFTLPSLVDVFRVKTAYEWRGMAGHVAAQARADDFILFIPAFARIPFEYYFKGTQQRMSLNPKQLIQPRPVTQFKAEFSPRLMTEIARAHPRMWIIATIPIGYEARKEIGKELEPYFREVDGTSFGLVYAFLWESRTYGAAPSRLGGP